MRLKETFPWMALLLTGVLAFSVACLVTARPDMQSTTAESGSYTARLFGHSRLALSSDFYQMADVYFHKGVGDAATTAITNGFFVNCESEIAPHKVAHLNGSSAGDVLPWIWMAIRADPQNIVTYEVAAFFLSAEVGRFDLAHKLLQEGRANNPFSYEIAMEEGMICLKEKDNEAALKYFNAADAFWPGKKAADAPEALSDKAQIIFLRSLINEDAGRIAEAMQDLRHLVTLFPDMPAYRQHLELLETGNQPSMLAKPLLRDMLRNQDRLEEIDTKHGGHAHEEHADH